jgi:hypothetical protein
MLGDLLGTRLITKIDLLLKQTEGDIVAALKTELNKVVTKL